MKIFNGTLQKRWNYQLQIALTTVNVLFSRSEDLSLKNIKTTLMWRCSILQSLGFRVGLAGSTDKCSIKLTLTVTLDGKILPFQIIYGAKTNQSLLKITFPAKFSTSEKHYSNNEEVITHLQEVVIPYVNEETKNQEMLINMHY